MDASVPPDGADTLTAFKQRLFLLPHTANYRFDSQARRDLRRLVMAAVADDTRWLDLWFPRLSLLGADAVADLDRMNWSYNTYYQQVPHERDPKYNQLMHWVNHQHHPCGRLFHRGETIFRCLTCSHDELCAVCYQCFHQQNHEGHRVHVYVTQLDRGGVCDCGDHEAWVTDNVCPYYDNPPSTPLPAELPEEFYERFAATVRVVLNYFVDVLAFSDQHLTGAACALPADHAAGAALSPVVYGYDEQHQASQLTSPFGTENLDNSPDPVLPRYSLVLYNDQVHLYRDAIQRIRLALKKQKQFAAMVTDKAESYGRAKVVSLVDVPVLQTRQKILAATGLATAVRNDRDLFREDMVDELLAWLDEIQDLEVFRYRRRLQDILCQVFAEKWQPGIALVVDSEGHDQATQPLSQGVPRVGELSSGFQIPKLEGPVVQPDPESAHWHYEPLVWQLNETDCALCDYNQLVADFALDASHRGLRFQYLCYFEVRLWKNSRNALARVANLLLITLLRFRLIFGCQYLDIYGAVTDMFTRIDREPELNMMLMLLTQLFTCPSIIEVILAHGDLARILLVVYGFLTTEAVAPPNAIRVTNEVSIRPLKNQKLGKLFFDVNFMLQKRFGGFQVLQGDNLRMACDMMVLAQGKLTLKREQDSHVEYELPDYTAFFNSVTYIYKFGVLLVRCGLDLAPAQRDGLFGDAVVFVIGLLLRLERGQFPRFSLEAVDIDPSAPTKREPYTGAAVTVHRLLEDKVSFLHPVHSFLGMFLKNGQIDLATVKQLFATAIAHDGNPLTVEDHVTLETALLTLLTRLEALTPLQFAAHPLVSIFDYPVRTLALMLQIKLGFWVRNGYTVRNQLQLYRLLGLREYGYMHDLFLSQVFCNIAPPDLVSYLILDRWQLLNVATLGYDAKILPLMIEECALTFYHMLTEDLYVALWLPEELSDAWVRREVVHLLCFGPMTYTKLIAPIPDHVTAAKRFARILGEISTYAPPAGAADTGVYTMRPEYLDQVNPFYFSYSANTREDAMNLIKQRIASTTGVPVAEAVVTPVPVTSERGYRWCGNFCLSRHFVEFVTQALSEALATDATDGMLTVVLHLVHGCALEANVDGLFFEVASAQHHGESLVSMLYRVLVADNFGVHRPKVRAIFGVWDQKYLVAAVLRQQVSRFSPEALVAQCDNRSAEDETARKKRIAMERQRKLLAKFKKQQTLFVAKNFDSGDVDMEATDDDTTDDPGWLFPEPHCILCQNAADDLGPFGIITHILRSLEFRKVPFDDPYWMLEAFSDLANLDDPEPVQVPTNFYEVGTLPEPETSEPKTSAWRRYMAHVRELTVFGPGFDHPEHVDANLVLLLCGHGMHYHCYLNYLNNNRLRQHQITRNYPENPERKEFLCPLCKAINNSFYPILWANNNRSLATEITVPALNTTFLERLSPDQLANQDWFDQFAQALHDDVDDACNLTATAREWVAAPSSDCDSQAKVQYWRLIESMFHLFAFTCFPEVVKLDSVVLLCNTIKSNEIALRGVLLLGLLVIDDVSNINMINLRVLLLFRLTGILMKLERAVLPQLRQEALMVVVSSYLSLSQSQLAKSIVGGRDFFSTFIECVPLPLLGFDAHTTLSACFLGAIVQSLAVLARELAKQSYYTTTNQFTVLDVPMVESVSEADAENAKQLFCALSGHDHPIFNEPLFGQVIFSMLAKAITPFLRRAAIYLHVQCANVDCGVEAEPGESEAVKLCRFMKIDLLSQVLARIVNPESSFARHVFAEVVELTRDTLPLVRLPRLEYPGIVRLIRLPERLDLFFTRYYYSDKYDRPCTRFDSPAVCMFCAEVMEVQQKTPGSKEGQCTTHVLKECASNTGIFWLPRERVFLLLHENGGSFHTAPYIDDAGEVFSDPAKRLKAMFLMPPRYVDFTKSVWLQHNIPNIIVRSLDSVLDAGGWDTL